MGLLDSALNISLKAAELGFIAAEAALKTAQNVMENAAGVRRDDNIHAPVNGPRDIDHALSELANRTARIVHYTPAHPEALPAAWTNWTRALRSCFEFVDWQDPRTLLLPLQLPLSLGTLMTSAGLRGVAALNVIGAPRYLEFLRYTIQIFSDFPVYVRLEYLQVIERHQGWLRAHPEDHTTRTELGRALVKVGRYDEAITELTRAAEAGDAKLRSTAMHEAGLAHHFSGRFHEAVRAGCAALEADPHNAPARFWTWLAAERVGGYPPDVPQQFRLKIGVGWSKPSVQYDEISARIGIDKTSGGRGIAVFDYNNDGRLDVALAAAHAGVSLYRNNGDGTFTDASVESGLYDAVNTFGVSAGDYNNDGYPDLLFCRMGFFGGEIDLWRNNGDGTFTKVTEEAGVACWGPSFSCSWVDYDCDGWLDLFVCTNLGGLFDRKTQNRLFRNNGDGTFTEVAVQAGITSIWPSIGHSWGDYNNDGYPDLFLSNAIGPPQLFRNNGDGTFTDVTDKAGVGNYTLAFGAQFFDIDDDGWLDIIQYSWAIHEDVIHSLETGETPPYGHPTRVYRNNRDGTFTLVSRELGIIECWGSMSGNAADLNNDGFPDIALGNGGPLMDRTEPMVVLENDGKRFRNVTFAAGLPFTGKGHGLNCADLFGDGRLSILVGTGGNYPGDLLTTSVFCPKERPGNYLAVKLKGVKSNRDAIGARLKLTAGGRDQHRVLNGGSNFGCLPPQQHFGLGGLSEVDALEVWWPSGLRQRFEHLPVNCLIHITEGEPSWI
jgi:hypothetical protein